MHSPGSQGERGREATFKPLGLTRAAQQAASATLQAVYLPGLISPLAAAPLRPAANICQNRGRFKSAVRPPASADPTFDVAESIRNPTSRCSLACTKLSAAVRRVLSTTRPAAALLLSRSGRARYPRGPTRRPRSDFTLLHKKVASTAGVGAVGGHTHTLMGGGQIRYTHCTLSSHLHLCNRQQLKRA